MRVLVTGGAGLIGMALRRRLKKAGHEVVATDLTNFGRDDADLVLLPLADTKAHERLIAERRIEVIVHGGGVSGPMMFREQAGEIVDINVGSTVALLDAARRHGVGRFLLLSSHVVYGDVGDGIIDEAQRLRPATTYAASKVAGEALVESFSRQWGLSAASLRLTRVYGPYRRDNCFLRQILIDAAAGRQTVIPCDPDYAYHFVAADDVADAVLASVLAPSLGHYSYNVSSGEVLTMPQIRQIALDGVPGAQVDLVPGVDDAPERQADFALDAIRQDTGWQPRLGLAEGLSTYHRHFQQDPRIVR